MSLLDDAKAIDGGRGPGCTVCQFIEDQPDDIRPEFDELLNTPGKKGTTNGDGYAVGHQATLRILQREGFQASSSEPVRGHRRGGHRK